MVIGTRELHWHDNEYTDQENESRLKGIDMVARVRMFFGPIREPDYPYGKTSVDEDFSLPDGFDHYTDYSLIEKLLATRIETRMAEIQDNVHDTNSRLVPDQRERVENDHSIGTPGEVTNTEVAAL